MAVNVAEVPVAEEMEERKGTNKHNSMGRLGQVPPHLFPLSLLTTVQGTELH